MIDNQVIEADDWWEGLEVEQKTEICHLHVDDYCNIWWDLKDAITKINIWREHRNW